MDDKKKKVVDEDTTVQSYNQRNDIQNVPYKPTHEDDIDLKSPSVQGEEAVSGDDPDPESDDDTLSNAHAVGQQLGEDLEHPQEIDIARDIDNAEKAYRES